MNLALSILFIFSCVALLYGNKKISFPALFYFRPCAFILFIFILQSCHSDEEKKDPAQTTAPVKQAIEVATVTEGSLASSIKIPGELIAWQQVDLYAKVSSFIKTLSVDVGSEVRQGQLLATMEAPEINSQLSASNSKLKSFEAIYTASKANYDRLVETSKTPGTISPNDIDMANARQKSDYAQYQAARSSYNEVINNSNYLQIRAPFSGVISARNVSQGAYVGPSGKGSEMPLFTLQTQQKLRLVVAVPETYTTFLKSKNEVSFTVMSMPNQTFKALVNRKAGSLDSKFRSERIEMDVNNTDKKLMPGMVAEIQIVLPAGQNTFLVPKAALVNALEGIAVIKIARGKAEWISVKKGRESEEQVEVYGNLHKGDTIVAKGNEEIRDGMEIGKINLAGE